ncbi:MAG: hypothetical protein FWD72_05615, partial [Eggerthellaceae bacterium]|nr:hypothetical protein [Eggerthellaceae bacterium]
CGDAVPAYPVVALSRPVFSAPFLVFSTFIHSFACLCTFREAQALVGMPQGAPFHQSGTFCQIIPAMHDPVPHIESMHSLLS